MEDNESSDSSAKNSSTILISFIRRAPTPPRSAQLAQGARRDGVSAAGWSLIVDIYPTLIFDLGPLLDLWSLTENSSQIDLFFTRTQAELLRKSSDFSIIFLQLSFVYQPIFTVLDWRKDDIRRVGHNWQILSNPDVVDPLRVPYKLYSTQNEWDDEARMRWLIIIFRSIPEH